MAKSEGKRRTAPTVFPPATTDEVMLAKVINGDWNHYLSLTKFAFDLERTKGFRPRAADATPERVALFVAMIRWARERKVDPRFWVFALFSVRAWKWPPTLTVGCVCSDTLEKKLPRIRDKSVLRKRIDESPLVAEQKIPETELVPHTEALKQRYAESGQAQRCMQEMFAVTKGYHPRSPVCAACPLKQPCALQLAAAYPYDVIGARNGA
jgi:hypothetical protein